MTDEKMVTRLEPILFIIIGYYFGRLPAQHNEKTLKDELSRQMQKADAAQHAKEQMQQAREALEERVKNVKATLILTPPDMSPKGLVDSADKRDGLVNAETLRHSVAAALNILNS